MGTCNETKLLDQNYQQISPIFSENRRNEANNSTLTALQYTLVGTRYCNRASISPPISVPIAALIEAMISATISASISASISALISALIVASIKATISTGYRMWPAAD